MTDHANYRHEGAESVFPGSKLDHVSIYASDVRRSAAYYQRVFGCSALSQQGETIRLSAGNGYISLRRGSPAGIVDHFAIGIDHFEEEAIVRELKSRGVAPIHGDGAAPASVREKGLHVLDPDGYPVQVIANSV